MSGRHRLGGDCPLDGGVRPHSTHGARGRHCDQALGLSRPLCMFPKAVQPVPFWAWHLPGFFISS